VNEEESKESESVSTSFVEFQAKWEARLARDLKSFARARLLKSGVPESLVSAEDIVQDTWEQIYRRRGKIKVFEPYMWEVARSLISKAGRQANKQAGMVEEEPGQSPRTVVLHVRAPADPLDEVLNKELHQVHEEGLEELSSTQKKAYIAREDGLSFKEMVHRDGKTISTWSQHHRRAKDALQKRLMAYLSSGLAALLAWLSGLRHRPGRTQNVSADSSATSQTAAQASGSLFSRSAQAGGKTFSHLSKPAKVTVVASAMAAVVCCGLVIKGATDQEKKGRDIASLEVRPTPVVTPSMAPTNTPTPSPTPTPSTTTAPTPSVPSHGAAPRTSAPPQRPSARPSRNVRKPPRKRPLPPLQVSADAGITPENHSGPCPDDFGEQILYTVSVNRGPVTLTYREVVNGDPLPARTETFTGKGPQTRNFGGFLNSPKSGTYTAYIEILSPVSVRSNTATASITCTH
jgi:RNA polymerase sigma factor (sigma-70 family)